MSPEPLLFLWWFLCLLIYLFFNVYECFAYICAGCPQRLEEGIKALGNGVIHGCDPPYGCWESNIDPLEEQPLNH